MLNELLKATRDGAMFYTIASRKVGDPTLSVVFNRMAHSKRGLLGAMLVEVPDVVEEAEASAASGALLRALYDESLEAIDAGRRDFAYIGQLEKSEDQLMEAFRDVIRDDSTSAPVRQTVAGYLASVRKHYDSLRHCKKALEARRAARGRAAHG